MRHRALAALAVAALLVTAGCSGLTGSDATDASAIAEEAATAMEDVGTYQMDMRMEVTASGQTLSMRQVGAFNRTTERARLNMSLYGTAVVAYLDGTTMYMNVGGQWQTQDLSANDPWESGSGLARQQQLLETGNVSVNGTATVDGVETTVLAVDADPGQLKQLLSRQSTGGFQGVTIESATYRLYVATESKLPRKAEMTMNMSIQGETAVADMTVNFSAYGEPVHVEIPEEATA